VVSRLVHQLEGMREVSRQRGIPRAQGQHLLQRAPEATLLLPHLGVGHFSVRSVGSTRLPGPQARFGGP